MNLLDLILFTFGLACGALITMAFLGWLGFFHDLESMRDNDGGEP